MRRLNCHRALNLISIILLSFLIVSCFDQNESKAKDIRINPGLSAINNGKWLEAGLAWEKDCGRNPNSCLDLAWLNLWQLDSAKSSLDSLWLLRQSLEWNHEIFTIVNLNSKTKKRAIELHGLAVELKNPIYKIMDSLSQSQVQTPELSDSLKALKADILTRWTSPQFDSLQHLLLKRLSTDSKSVELRDFHLRTLDLKDIQNGFVPDRKMTWVGRLGEWRWP